MKLFISAQSLPDPKSMPQGRNWVDDASEDELRSLQYVPGKPTPPDFLDADVRRLSGALEEIRTATASAMKKLEDLRIQNQHARHQEAISVIRSELQMIEIMSGRLAE